MHPWHRELNYQVYAGFIILEDRKGKKVEAFTFGGSLQIQTREEITICTFESEAPILEMGMKDPMRELLVEEVDIILAERSAAALPDERGFEKRLAQVNSCMLYYTSAEVFHRFKMSDSRL